MQKIRTFKRFYSNFFPNLSNVLNILLTSLFLQKIQIFERFNSDESLVNFSHLEKIHRFKKFCSGEYLSHLQKIQLFGRFDCGESLKYFSHHLNISHICKDSDIQKIPPPENTILSLGQNLNIIFSTSLHFTPLHLHCLPHFTPLCATSLRLPFCLGHFTPPSVIFASLHLSSRHFTSTPILSASLHPTSPHFTLPPVLFASLHVTSLCFTHPVFSASLHATSHFTAHFVWVTSRRLLLFKPHFTFMPLHATSLCLLFFFCITSPHFMPLHFASHSFCITSPHFVPLCFSPPFSLPHFKPLHFSSCLSASLHSTSRHFTSCFVFLTSRHFAPLQAASVIFASLHTTSLHLPSFCLTSPHLISSVRPAC